MVTIVDYGVGNLFSLKSSFAYLGKEVAVTRDPETLLKADRLLLPGVGAFADAAKKLRDLGLDQVLLQKAAEGTPILGICLGMQLLFDRSLEYGDHKGLGLIPGTVKPIRDVVDASLKVPHIGWNALRLSSPKHPVFRYVEDGSFVYFVHSFAGFDCADACIATTEYSGSLTAAVARGNVCGCQFHPEKSGKIGLAILQGFCEWEGD